MVLHVALACDLEEESVSKGAVRECSAIVVHCRHVLLQLLCVADMSCFSKSALPVNVLSTDSSEVPKCQTAHLVVGKRKLGLNGRETGPKAEAL